MTKIDHLAIFLIVAAMLASATIIYPDLFGEKNILLNDFVDHDFMGFMGLIATITLASCANIYIMLRKIEKDAGEEFLPKTKKAVRASAFSLLWTLVISLALLTIKGALAPSLAYFIPATNTAALIICLWGLLVTLDVTRLAFKI